jgi:hypothetical protein
MANHVCNNNCHKVDGIYVHDHPMNYVDEIENNEIEPLLPSGLHNVDGGSTEQNKAWFEYTGTGVEPLLPSEFYLKQDRKYADDKNNSGEIEPLIPPII